MRYKGEPFIRVGSATKRLKDVPQIEARLWRTLQQHNFENGIAAANLTVDEILLRLDYPSYFDLLNQPLPDGNTNILDAIARDRLITRSDAGGWDITNLAAILLARDLREFGNLAHKRVRVIRYDGPGRYNTARERQFDPGYAPVFQRIIEHIMTLVPSSEVIEQALNVELPMFPEIAVRELVANALIHQDFFATGSAPLIEIFADRIEVTNPGEPLVETLRFLDAPPNSRNESMAALMRRFGICEERGSGIDKIVNLIEVHQLPAPIFEVANTSTRCVLFAPKILDEMGPEERVMACYWHACLRYVTNQPTNNRSMRERFNIPDRQTSRASKLLREAIDAGLIVVQGPRIRNAESILHSFVGWFLGKVLIVFHCFPKNFFARISAGSTTFPSSNRPKISFPLLSKEHVSQPVRQPFQVQTDQRFLFRCFPKNRFRKDHLRFQVQKPQRFLCPFFAQKAVSERTTFSKFKQTKDFFSVAFQRTRTALGTSAPCSR